MGHEMRSEGWETRLAEELAAAVDRPFEYGVFDCLTWAFGVRAALTGQDDRPLWLGRYSTERGAARVLKSEGLQSLEEVGHRLLGSALRSPLFARRGDIAFGGAFGIVTGETFVWPAEARGLMALPLADARVAWRVG